MIQVQTLLKVSDNSGGKIVRCLRILKKGGYPSYGKIGDVIVVSVQQIRSKKKITSKVKKSEVLYGVVVKTRSFIKRSAGISFCFDQNSVVLLNKQLKPFATRVLGVVPKELRKNNFSKIISLAAGVI
jgi:large subunit ribosomal protein L14|tara:strand:+ start:211 stop:594 length:384 start_codon:yes stop_codon:yes gene_type:complete